MHESTRKIADMLDDTKWGAEFAREEVEVVARYLALHTYEEGDMVFREGDQDNSMCFIIEGRVEIVKHSRDTLEEVVVTLHPRTHFGEMAFIDDEPRSASAVARDKVTLLSLSRSNFDTICNDHPKLAIKMLTKIAQLISRRLRMTTGKLVYTRD